MKAFIISIGNELLNGQTADTNTSWLAGRLYEMGISVKGSRAVPDEALSIIAALKNAAEDANIVLITGGLGPTDDDLTRQAVADFLDVELEFHPEILDGLNAFFAKRGKSMSEKNRSQAYIPVKCDVLDNLYGTAPGFCFQRNDVFFAVMPGVPAEMKRMFGEQVLPHIRKMHAEFAMASGKVRCFGPGESTLAQKLGALMDRKRNPLINCTCGSGEIIIHIEAKAQGRQKAVEMVEMDKKILTDLLGEWVYGYDDEPLAAAVGRLLRDKKQTIAVAESCTGGLVSKMLTDIPGASDYFMAGWVTYSNETKISQLEVPSRLIADFGAVSEPAAMAMAQSAVQKSGAGVSISTTGIAGPGGGTAEKPVGLVYIGVCVEKKCFVQEFRFPGADRDFIRKRSALAALNLIRLQLQI